MNLAKRILYRLRHPARWAGGVRLQKSKPSHLFLGELQQRLGDYSFLEHLRANPHLVPQRGNADGWRKLYQARLSVLQDQSISPKRKLLAISPGEVVPGTRSDIEIAKSLVEELKKFKRKPELLKQSKAAFDAIVRRQIEHVERRLERL